MAPAGCTRGGRREGIEVSRTGRVADSGTGTRGGCGDRVNGVGDGGALQRCAPRGRTWIADVPANWNGTLLLYSHGYGTLTAADAPDPATHDALLADGYALAGSSYDPSGSLWALGSAVRDQFQTLAAVKNRSCHTGRLRVLAFGTSMGGLISALEDQQSNGRLDGALTTCGLVAGGIQLNNYQLDGEYAIAKLLAPGQSTKLVNFSSQADGAATATALNAAAAQGQTNPTGRARLALAMALMNVAAWAPGATMPGVYDYAEQERQQYAMEFTANPVLLFVETGRQQIEQAAGGNGGWDIGVDFAQLLRHSSYRAEVRALYREAGLSLKQDLRTLTRGANIRADTKAIRWLQQTSVPTGRLQVPELDLHTIPDQLVPVQQENYYAAAVRAAGSNSLFRQAFVDRFGHCAFSARLERAVRAGIAERVRPYGLTTLQYTTLSVLNRHGSPLSNAQLARRAYMTPQAMSEVIDALAAKGLIRRSRHPNHGRLLPAALTPKGRRVLAECEREVDDMEAVMLGSLTGRERTAFLAALKSCVRALGAGFPHADGRSDRMARSCGRRRRWQTCTVERRGWDLNPGSP